MACIFSEAKINKNFINILINLVHARREYVAGCRVRKRWDANTFMFIFSFSNHRQSCLFAFSIGIGHHGETCWLYAVQLSLSKNTSNVERFIWKISPNRANTVFSWMCLKNSARSFGHTDRWLRSTKLGNGVKGREWAKMRYVAE